MSAQAYRHYAAECLRISNSSQDVATKTTLLNMAVAWTKLADQADKNLQNDVVYEPPLKEGK
jgi:hypothetical protein